VTNYKNLGLITAVVKHTMLVLLIIMQSSHFAYTSHWQH